MKNLKLNINGIVLSIFELLVGILLLVSPVSFTSVIICTFGVALVVIGVISIIKYFTSNPEQAALQQNLFKGIVAVTGGVFCVLKTEWLISVFPLLTILYGTAILLAGISKIQWTVNMIRLKMNKWFLPAISAVVSIICAATIIGNPFTSTSVLWIFTGVSLIVEAVFGIIIIIMNSITKKD